MRETKARWTPERRKGQTEDHLQYVSLRPDGHSDDDTPVGRPSEKMCEAKAQQTAVTRKDQTKDQTKDHLKCARFRLDVQR